MSLAQETARKGITVNSVAPGYISTEMVAGRPEGGPGQGHRQDPGRPPRRARRGRPRRGVPRRPGLRLHHRPDLLRQRRPVHVVPRRAGRRRLPARRLPGPTRSSAGAAGWVWRGRHDGRRLGRGPNGHQQGRSDPDDLPQRRRAHVDRDRHGDGPAPVHRTPSRPRAGRVEDPRADRRRRLLRRVAAAADRRRRRRRDQPRGTRLSGAAGPLPGPRRRRPARRAGRPRHQLHREAPGPPAGHHVQPGRDRTRPRDRDGQGAAGVLRARARRHPT